MTKLWISSDLHLGHKNITKFRTEFSSAEEHHETVFENLATAIGKRDSLYLLGDVVFTPEWLARIESIRCIKKTLILGNHCTDQKISILQLCNVFDSIHSLHAKRNHWFSHAPIHPSEMRGKAGNIHGHTHYRCIDDPRYFNVSVEQTCFRPIAFQEIMDQINERFHTDSQEKTDIVDGKWFI